MKNLHNRREVLIYAAGLFDGEGCVLLRRRPSSSSHIAMCSLNNNSVEAVDFFFKNFGGSKRLHSLSKTTGKEVFEWTVSYRKAVIFIREILPYLIIKKSQAELLVYYYDNVVRTPQRWPKRKLIYEEIIERERVFAEMKALKRGKIVDEEARKRYLENLKRYRIGKIILPN